MTRGSLFILFNFYLKTDQQHLTIHMYFFTAWKEPIILMATTGIAAGVVGEGLIVLTALLQRCTKNFIVHLCANILSVTSIFCACE